MTSLTPREYPLWRTLEAAAAAEAAKSTPRWRPSPLTAVDWRWIRREGAASPFDRANLRAGLLEGLADGKARAYARVCEYGRVIVVTKARTDQVPWESWGRIFRMFGGGGAGKPMQMLWFAAQDRRTWPARGKPVGPENVNGGYCQVCRPNTVVVYRAEDATRVLVHELLHGCCTDSPADPVEIVEAKTEAWAEIILASLREAGLAGPVMSHALEQQLAWSAAQNARLVADHRVRGPTDYAWRYTLGKTAALEAMGFAQMGAVKAAAPHATLRLTPPNGVREGWF